MKILPRREAQEMIDFQSPFDQLRTLMERDFEPWFGTEHVIGTTPLALNVADKDGNIVVETAIPGVDEDDIEIRYDNGILTVQAETKTEKEEKEDNWYLRELRVGKVSRSVRLPEDVDIDKAEALLEKGMLTVTLPKKQNNAIQRIAVKAKELLTPKKS